MRRDAKAAQEQYLKHLELIRSESKINPFESKEEQEQAILKAQKDVNYCVERYFPHYATAENHECHLELAKAVKRNKLIKGIIEWPRGFGKSVWVDVIIPFWLWINGEVNYVVLIGQNEDKGKQLLSDIQGEFQANPQIIKDFGEQKLIGSWETGDFRTKGCTAWNLKPFLGKALGMGQEVRGLRIGSQRPDLCILDDIETRELIKNAKRQDEYVTWVLTALVPTMDGPKRRLLYANNRFAVRMIQTELLKKNPSWFVSHYKAYDKVTYKPTWSAKYPDSYYKELEKDIGRIALQQEYLQEPVIEGKIFKPEQIIWDTPPRLDHFKAIVGHWDIAYAGTATSDFNAVKIWGLDKDNLFWCLQAFVKQTKMREAVAYMCDVQKRLPTSVTIHWRYEAQFWNDEVKRTINETSKEFGINLRITQVDTPRTKKFDRMLSRQPMYQNSRIRYNKKMEADNDMQIGLTQLYALEPGYNGHDDSPDADEQAITFLEKFINDAPENNTPYRGGRMKGNNEAI